MADDSIIAQDEDAIKDALFQAMPSGVAVESFPGAPEEAFDLITPPGGAVYVLYFGGSFLKGETTGPTVTQPWVAEFRVLVVAEDIASRLAASRLAYSLVDIVRRTLSGLELPGGGCLKADDERIFALTMGKCAYLMKFSTKNRIWRK